MIIPADAVILSAELSLYFYTELDAFFGGHYGDNGGRVSRVTSSWEEEVVTWDSQPSYSTENQVSFAGLSGTNDLVDLDITTLIKDMQNDPANSHGIMFQLLTESQFRALAFVSSDYANATKRPKLVVKYIMGSENCFDEILVNDSGASGIYAAKNIIESSESFSILNNTTFKAEIVSLKAGFHVIPSGENIFLAKAESCEITSSFRENTAYNNRIQTTVESVIDAGLNFSLSPNPFKEETFLNFNLPEPSNVNVQVFSVSGQLITTIIRNQPFPSGNHSISFNNPMDYKGMLFFVLETEQGSFIRKGIQQKK